MIELEPVDSCETEKWKAIACIINIKPCSSYLGEFNICKWVIEIFTSTLVVYYSVTILILKYSCIFVEIKAVIHKSSSIVVELLVIM